MRCASIHRKLGTHISKVKSLSMDTWSVDQVDVSIYCQLFHEQPRHENKNISLTSFPPLTQNIKRTGNLSSNRQYNPKNTKPNIPIDADEVDSAMERFIREKYQHKTLSGEGRPLPAIRRNHTGSSASDDIPPPLPPKNSGAGFAPPKFRVASASGSYPQRGLPSPPASDATNSSVDVAGRMTRVSEGETYGARRSFESKLGQLRDMGFTDDRRNNTVLKALDGNVERSVEALVRLEGGSGRNLNGAAAEGDVAPTPRRSVTQPAVVNGLSFDEPGARNTQSAQSSTVNGFFAQNTGQPQPQPQPNVAQRTGSSVSSNPFQAYMTPQPQMSAVAQQQPPQPQYQPSQQYQLQYQQQPQQSLDTSFQQMSISHEPQQLPALQTQQQPQPIHPSNTGPGTFHQNPQNPYYKTYTPPLSPSPYTQPGQNSYNPYLRSPSQSQQSQFTGTNPFAQQMGVQTQMPQQTFYTGSSPLTQTPVTPFDEHPAHYYGNNNNNKNPFVQQHQQQAQFAPSNPYMQAQAQAQAQMQPQTMNMPTFRDKSSILALYNSYGQDGATPMAQSQPQPPQMQQQPQQLQPQQQQNTDQPLMPMIQRSATLPSSSVNFPFTHPQSQTQPQPQPQLQQQQPQQPNGHMSHASLLIAPSYTNQQAQPQAPMGYAHTNGTSNGNANANGNMAPTHAATSPIHSVFGGLSSRMG